MLTACNILRAWIFYTVLAVSIAGCSSTTVFTAYPGKINPLIHNLSTGKPIELEQCLTGERESNDLILYNMERGRYAHIVGELDVSMLDFSASIARIRQNDQKATISASAISADIAANITNDNAIPYQGEGYERVMLHHYQGLNYLFKRNLEGAGVEFRLANREQEEALKLFQREIEDARKTADKNQVRGDTSAVEQRYAQMDELAGRVKNSFQNAYSFYLSGFMYELNNLPNDAYIDYKRALEIYPNNTYLQRDVIRLADTLGMREELAQLKKRFGGSQLELVSRDGQNTGELLVVYEDGFVPQKKEIKIPLPIPTVGLVAIAFPIYNASWSREIPLVVSENNQNLGATEALCDFRALAVKALKEKAAIIATRQVLRAAAKGIKARAVTKNGGTLGMILDGIWNYVSENADLRSWLTLPANAQLLRVRLSPGTHTLLLESGGSNNRTSANVQIAANGRTILRVVRAGAHFYSNSIQLAP